MPVGTIFGWRTMVVWFTDSGTRPLLLAALLETVLVQSHRRSVSMEQGAGGYRHGMTQVMDRGAMPSRFQCLKGPPIGDP